MESNGSANHNDFEPLCVWHRLADREILEVHLQGFKKENLRVQVINQNILSVTGDRPLNDGKKRSRFEKKIELSNDVNTEKIQAKLGVCCTLSLVMPKKLNLIQNPKHSNGDDVASRHMKWSNGIGTKVMKVMKCKNMGPVVVVVVSAAMVVGFGAFMAQKYGPKYPFEN